MPPNSIELVVPGNPLYIDFTQPRVTNIRNSAVGSRFNEDNDIVFLCIPKDLDCKKFYISSRLYTKYNGCDHNSWASVLCNGVSDIEQYTMNRQIFSTALVSICTDEHRETMKSALEDSMLTVIMDENVNLALNKIKNVFVAKDDYDDDTILQKINEILLSVSCANEIATFMVQQFATTTTLDGFHNICIKNSNNSIFHNYLLKIKNQYRDHGHGKQ